MKRRGFFALMIILLCLPFVFSSCKGGSSSSTSSESTKVVTEGPTDGNTYTIKFNTNGGNRIYDQKYVSGKIVSVDNPYKFGATFEGWYNDEALTIPFEGYMPMNDTTIYAKWLAAEVDINLFYNSPSETDGTLEGKRYGDELVLPTPTRANAEFVGWYYDATFITPFTETVVPAAKTDAYALWRFTAGSTIYVSPSGTSSSAGTAADPLDIYSACYFAGPGVTINVQTGSYTISTKITVPAASSGTKAQMVKLNGNDVVFDCSSMGVDDSNRGLQLNASYWHIKNLQIKGAGDNGMLVGGNGNIVEQCVFTENRDTGLQISRYSATEQVLIDSWPSNNTILNCSSFNNADSDGEDADGFAAKLTVGYGNVFNGCISYNNSDDGWDLYAKADTGSIGTVILVNCVAFNNGRLLDETSLVNGDGNGFKLGGSNIKGHVILENCVAFNNNLHGFTDNSNPGTIIIKNCTSFNNGAEGGTKDNFNLARNPNKANNCYYGLLSYCNSSSYASASGYAINGDDFRGSIGYSILRVCLDKVTTNTYKIGDYIEGNSTNANSIGTIDNTMVSDSSFASVTIPTASNTLYKSLRNSDGSVNLGDFLKVTQSNLLTYCEGSQVGANLSKTSQSAYPSYSQPDTTGLTTGSTAELLKTVSDSLYEPTLKEAVFKDINLPNTMLGCTITWTSSNTTVLDPNNEYYPNTGVLARAKYDTDVTLTATISYTDSTGAKTTLTKAFDLTVKAYIPGIGDVSGYADGQVFLNDETYTNLDSSLVVIDRNSKTAAQLVLNTDYTTSYKFYNATKTNGTVNTTSDGYYVKGDEISVSVTASAGAYVGECTITMCEPFTETYTFIFNIDVISKTAAIDILNIDANYIVNKTVTADLTFSYRSGKLFYAFVAAGGTAPTTSKLKLTTPIDITGFSQEVIIDVGTLTSCDIYFMTMSESSGSKIYGELMSKKGLNGMVEISTTDAFISMISTQDSSPKAYALTANLDFTDVTWPTVSSEYYFAGLLDGYNFKLSNMAVSGKSLAGIFTNLKGGTVKNLVIENSTCTMVDPKQTSGVGMICGYMNGGTISNIQMTNCSVSGYEGVGGIVGTVNGGYDSNKNTVDTNIISKITIKNSSDYTISTTLRYGGGILGGILNDLGYTETYISDVYVRTNLNTKDAAAQYVGGVVGRYKNENLLTKLYVTNAYYYGEINSEKYGGGIVGGSDKEVALTYLTNCFALVTLTVVQSENRSICGATRCDDYTITNNVASIGDYDFGKDNAEYNITQYRTMSASFWSENGFDMDTVWEYDSLTGLTLR